MFVDTKFTKFFQIVYQCESLMIASGCSGILLTDIHYLRQLFSIGKQEKTAENL